MTSAIGGARPAGKAGSKFANAFYNKTATKATKGDTGQKFGQRKKTPWMEHDGDMKRSLGGFYGGMAAGGVGGMAAASKGESGQKFKAVEAKSQKNVRQLAANSRKINAHEKQKFGKSKVYTITDHGTPGAKLPARSKKPLAIAAGAATYAGASMYAGMANEYKQGAKKGAARVKQQNDRLAMQRKKMDAYGISKAVSEKRKNTSAAIVGAGATTAGVAALAGGVPGGKSDFAPIMNAKRGTGDTKVKRAAGTARSFGGAAAKGAPGGILGFRTSAHKGGTYGYKMQEYEDGPKKMKDNTEAFKRGRNAGKIAPEEKIIRHMKGGQKVANAALVGGVAAAAYGATRDKKIVSKSKDSRRDSALVGGGVAGAAIAHGGKHALKGQQNYWETSASKDIDRAGKIAPQTAGRRQSTKTPGVRTMYPSVSDGAIARNKLLDGMPKKKAEKVGRLRGSAAQGRHFAEVYGNTAKAVGRVRTPSLAVAGVGAAGLASSKKKVQKSNTMSPFGVDHG